MITTTIKLLFTNETKKIGETLASAGVAGTHTSTDSIHESRDNLGDGAVDKLLVGLRHGQHMTLNISLGPPRTVKTYFS